MIAIYPHHYAERAGFKLLSLQPEYIELLQMAIEQFENSQTVFFDMQLVATTARREELEIVRSLEGSEGIHAIAAMTRDMRQEQEALRQQEWRRHQAEALSPELYARFGIASSPYGQARLQDMNRRWQYQGHYSHFGDKALMRAFRQLSALEGLFQEAANELEKRYHKPGLFSVSIPESVYTPYKAYLDDVKAKIIAEQHRMTASMYERLLVASSEQDLACSDVLVHAFERLKATNVLKASFASDVKKERALTSERFNEFHFAIFAKGDTHVQNKTVQLPWFSPLVRESDGASEVVNPIPESSSTSLMCETARCFNLQASVPQKAPWPRWLFKGRALRHEFFKDTHAYASLSVARARLSECCEGDIDNQALDTLCFELSYLDSSFKGFFQKAQSDLQKMQKGFRKFLNKKTQAFLKAYQDSMTAVLKEEQAQLVVYLQRMIGALDRDLLAPSEQLTDMLDLVQGLKLADVESIKVQLGLVAEAMDRAIERRDGARLLEERIQAAQFLVEPLMAQTEQLPAEFEVVEAVLAAYGVLASNDAVAEVVIEAIDACVEAAHRDLVIPVKPDVMDDAHHTVFDAHYRYLTNIGQVALAAGQYKSRLKVTNFVDDVMCHYLSAFGNGEYALAMGTEERQAVTTTQAKLLEQLGDDATKKLVRNCQELQAEARFEELNVLATRYLRKYERRIVERHFAKCFESLEKSLFTYLASKHKLELTPAQMRHISELCTRMADSRVTDVAEFKGLNATDIAFLGLGGNLMNRLFGKRKVLQSVINIIAGVRVTARRLPHAPTKAQQEEIIRVLRAEVHQHMERHGNRELNAIVTQGRLFAESLPKVLAAELAANKENEQPQQRLGETTPKRGGQ